MRYIALTAFALVASSPALGQQASMAGIGTVACEQLVENMKPGSSNLESGVGLAVVAWAQGFISGINGSNIAAHRRTVDMSGGRAPELWSLIVAECRDNPQKTVGTITAEFYAHNMR